MTKLSLPLTKAKPLANKIIKALLPACEQIKIAGSIRRQKPVVGDIEIVAIPHRGVDLFGAPGENELELLLVDLVNQGRLTKGPRNGSKFKKFGIPAVPGLNLDLFITETIFWPVIFAIRTGSAEFSQQLVTQRNKKTRNGRPGLLPSEYTVSGGLVLDRQGIPKFLQDERDFLELCGGWVEPERRN